MPRWFPAVLLALALSASASAQVPVVGQPAKGRKVAFLVGVGTYKHSLPDLEGVPEKDASELEKVLKKQGFEIVSLIGSKATKKAVEAKFKAVFDGGGDDDKSLGRGDVVLVQLCTHGFTIDVNGKKEPYLAGYDSRPEDLSSLVGLNDLIRASSPFGATTLFLVDACRETTDPNRGATRGVEGGQLTLPKNTAVLFSCGVGQVAHQPSRLKHGLFTYAVLKALRGETGLNGPVSWADLVSHVGKAFRSPEFKKHIPAEQPQTPFAVQGETEDVELARVKPTAAVAKFDPADTATEAAKVRVAALRGDADVGDALRAAGGGRVAEWKAASSAGDAAGMYLYALALADGIGVPADEKAAVALLDKASAAGDVWSMGALGGLYADGRLDAPNVGRAVEWCRKGAAAGNPVAMHHLGYLHETGDGVEQDDKKAFEWYRKAAEAGHADAMMHTGLCHQRGRGVPASDRLAAEWYQKAAALDEPKAMNSLGYLYQHGRGVEQDYKKAFGWYRTAAKLGNAVAMNNLGFLHQQGHGTKQDYAEALKWYRRSAEKKWPGAFNNLGFMYQKGYGVKADPRAAFDYYLEAAERKNPDGMYNVGWCHARGIGTPVNLNAARKWYKMAADLGDEGAKAELKKLGG